VSGAATRSILCTKPYSSRRSSQHIICALLREEKGLGFSFAAHCTIIRAATDEDAAYTPPPSGPSISYAATFYKALSVPAFSMPALFAICADGSMLRGRSPPRQK